MDRARRKEQVDHAYQVQVKSGLLGAFKGTLFGLALVAFAHHTWPVVRRQTLAIKGFIVSSCTIFGLVVAADTALLSHEADFRMREERLRREARFDLARQGKVATEPEIARWIKKREMTAKEKEAMTGDQTL